MTFSLRTAAALASATALVEAEMGLLLPPNEDEIRYLDDPEEGNRDSALTWEEWGEDYASYLSSWRHQYGIPYGVGPFDENYN